MDSMKRLKHIVILISISLVFSVYSVGASAFVCTGDHDCIHCSMSRMHQMNQMNQVNHTAGHHGNVSCCGDAVTKTCDIETHKTTKILLTYLPKISETDVFSWSTVLVASIADRKADPFHASDTRPDQPSMLRSIPIILQTLSLLC